jgi:hypothetical protein
VWHYGLWPSFSSLIVKRPDRGATLILLANSDGLNARFPMAEGDVRVSPFARAFLSRVRRRVRVVLARHLRYRDQILEEPGSPPEPWRRRAASITARAACTTVNSVRACSPTGREADDFYLPVFIPVTGSRNSLFSPPTGPTGANRNMFSIDPAFSSNEKLPIRPVSQLSSMKRSTEV